MDQEKLKQINKKELELCKEDAEEEYSKLIEEIKKNEYVNASIEGARNGFTDELQKVDEFYNSTLEMEKDVRNIEKESKNIYKMIEKDVQLDVPKNTFTFPQGDPKEIYDLQIKALKCANACYQIKEQTNEAVDMFCGRNNNFKQQSKKMFDCTVCIYGGYDAKKIKTALKSVVDKKDAEKYTKEFANETEDFNYNIAGKTQTATILKDREIYVDYETARKIKFALQNAGIKATIKNKIYAGVLKEHRLDELDNIDLQCKKIKGKISEEYKEKNKPYRKDYVNAKVFSILFFPLLCIFSMVAGIAEVNIGSTAFVLYVIPFIVGSLYLLCGFGIYKIHTISYFNSLFLKEQTEIICDNCAEKVRFALITEFDYYSIFEGVDKIVNEVYEKRVKALNKAEEVYGTIVKVYETAKNKFEKLINFMPPSTNYAALPRIIELMEKGAAPDYKTAVQLVENEINSKNASDEIMELLEAAEEAKRAEMQAQRYIQEYYEQQRLEAAKEQAASQRRTEELAKKQAEAATAAAKAAERNAEASEAARKAAEKQAEDTEELLRRTNDPYYINRWKKGE